MIQAQRSTGRFPPCVLASKPGIWWEASRTVFSFETSIRWTMSRLASSSSEASCLLKPVRIFFLISSYLVDFVVMTRGRRVVLKR